MPVEDAGVRGLPRHAAPIQHVTDGGADAGVGADVELERLCRRRASEVGDQAEVMPSLK